MSMPSVIFESSNNLFAINSSKVISIINLPSVSFLPNSPKNIRGIIKHRNEIYTVVDFRILNSQISIIDELSSFILMLKQREKEHIEWINELENSIIEKREFSLATDPHKCKFGMWYDNYKTNNLAIQKILNKFKEPHEKIHAIAFKIKEFKNSNNINKANKLIENTRNLELNSMISLFSQLGKSAKLEFKESAILLNINSNKIALTVDKLNSIGDIKFKDNLEFNYDKNEVAQKNFITGIGESEKKDLVLMVNEDNII